MKLAPALALALAACATSGRPAHDAPRPRADLVPVARAMTAIDAAARKGGDAIAAERQRRSAAAEATPRDPAARYLAVYAQPRDEDRWAAFRALWKAFPDSALGEVGMAGVYVEWRVYDQADRAVAAALEIEPDHWLAVLHRAQAAEGRQRLAAAAADYRTVLAADPGSPEAHLGLARIARASGDAATAEAEAQAALAAAPGLSGANALLAGIALERGDRVTAAARWELAVEASPRDRDARVALARLLREAGDAPGAVAQWRAAVDLQEDAASLAALAEAARAANDAKAELLAIERLSALDPSAAEWRRVAEIRMTAGDWDGAERAFRRALARDPKDARASAGLGKALLRRGAVLDAVDPLRAAGDAGRADLAPLEQRLHLERVARPDVAGIQKAVQALVDRTYRARAAEAAMPAGRLELRAIVGASGAASAVEILDDTVHDQDVRACAYWNLRDAAYPKDRPGRFTFVFAFRR